MTEPPDTTTRIEAALTALRTEATQALQRLGHHHTRATELAAAADTERRAYATEYRAIRARGLFTIKQLRELGFTAPRTRQRRNKPTTTPTN